MMLIMVMIVMIVNETGDDADVVDVTVMLSYLYPVYHRLSVGCCLCSDLYLCSVSVHPDASGPSDLALCAVLYVLCILIQIILQSQQTLIQSCVLSCIYIDSNHPSVSGN